MIIRVLEEAGYTHALLGLSLSYNSEPSQRVAERLAFKGNGESKFLESIDVWLDVTAPRYWWSQADTYRLTTKQSESTMHTLMKGELTHANFEGVHWRVLESINDCIRSTNLETAKKNLPESFLQRRVWKVSYMTLQSIIAQRSSHKLVEWPLFIRALESLEHPEFLFPKETDG